ncbi:MAG: hypothetical protein EOO38_02885 [Cytophagaceae bacterium]|nr:MAG: hypothetical protein EOO38_02885 [Cytophagaceae bacterium]
MSRIYVGEKENENSEREMQRLMQPLLTPKVIKSMRLPIARKRELARRAGMKLRPGETFADLALIGLPEESEQAIAVFAAKIAKALHFMHTGAIVPERAAIEHRWFTNFDQVEGAIPDDIFTLPTGIAQLRRTHVDLSDQFNYRYAVSNDAELSIFTIWFRFAFCIVVMITFDPALMVQVNAEAKRKIES